MTTHSIEVLEGQDQQSYDICIDGYVHKRHRNMSRESVNACLKSLRIYYANIGDGWRIKRQTVVA